MIHHFGGDHAILDGLVVQLLVIHLRRARLLPSEGKSRLRPFAAVLLTLRRLSVLCTISYLCQDLKGVRGILQICRCDILMTGRFLRGDRARPDRTDGLPGETRPRGRIVVGALERESTCKVLAGGCRVGRRVRGYGTVRCAVLFDLGLLSYSSSTTMALSQDTVPSFSLTPPAGLWCT
jgi:hypothetical protein